jgi:hypothetical protein
MTQGSPPRTKILASARLTSAKIRNVVYLHSYALAGLRSTRSWCREPEEQCDTDTQKHHQLLPRARGVESPRNECLASRYNSAIHSSRATACWSASGDYGTSLSLLCVSLQMRDFLPWSAVYGTDQGFIFGVAAALLHSLILDHPFVDDNRRTATLAIVVFARLNGHKVRWGERGALQYMLDIATGWLDLQGIGFSPCGVPPL